VQERNPIAELLCLLVNPIRQYYITYSLYNKQYKQHYAALGDLFYKKRFCNTDLEYLIRNLNLFCLSNTFIFQIHNTWAYNHDCYICLSLVFKRFA